MARANDFVDPDYDAKLLKFKAEKERRKKELAEQKPASNNSPRVSRSY